jgi:hypothetical protein
MEINPLIFFICFKAFFLLILPPRNKPNQNADRDFIAEGRNSSSFFIVSLGKAFEHIKSKPKGETLRYFSNI